MKKKSQTVLLGMSIAGAVSVMGAAYLVVRGGDEPAVPPTQMVTLPTLTPPTVNLPAVNLPAAVQRGGASASASVSPCPTSMQPQIDAGIPATMCTTQGCAVCFAWQDFISLNWPAGPGAGNPADASPDAYGAPGDAGNYEAVVWTTYKDTSEIFLADAAPPPPWDWDAGSGSCSLPSPPGNGQVPHRAERSHLTDLQLVPEGAPLGFGSIQPDGFWLADKNGNLVWYEIKVNQPYFDYIVDAGLYSSANQWALSQPGRPGVDPPAGSIALKAAWRELTAREVDAGLDSRYLMMDACVPGPGGNPRYARLGLVGLHIVHKPNGQPNWLWSTFEQIDNAPDSADTGAPPPSDAGWSFYNPACQPHQVPAACVDAGLSSTVGCDSKAPAPPLYSLAAYFDGGSDTCGPYPIQVTRVTPIPGCDAGCDPSGNCNDCSPSAQVNAAMQQMIQGANPSSVFQYYQIVNVVWWGSATVDHMDGGFPEPLSTVGKVIAPGYPRRVANTTLETYDQSSNCLSCHPGAAVSTAGDGGACDGGTCASDYSFIFRAAQYAPPAGPPAPNARRR